MNTLHTLVCAFTTSNSWRHHQSLETDPHGFRSTSRGLRNTANLTCQSNLTKDGYTFHVIINFDKLVTPQELQDIWSQLLEFG